MTRLEAWPSLVLAMVALIGCAGGSDTRGDASATTCTNDIQCDDGFDCTIDTCGVGNTCVYDTIDERCEMGQTCEPGRGCVATSSCASDDDCDDAFPCTTDTCGVGGICNHRTVDERCPMGQTCDVDMGCIEPAGCGSADECDDGVECTNDTCSVDRVCTNTPLDEMCDASAGERCDARRGCIVPMDCTEDSDCDDGIFCNGREVCGPEFGCESAGPPMCDDSDDCTLDSCDMGMDMCVFACDTSRPECECPVAGPSCSGDFNLPGAAGNCLGALGFSWDFTNVTFTNLGGAIEVTGWTVSTTAMVPEMADPGPACPNINAETTLAADMMSGCNETYRIMGTFTDDNTFEGTFSATFDSFCASCSMTVPVTGTRR